MNENCSNEQVVYRFEKNLRNSRNTYIQLIQLHNLIVNNLNKHIILDFCKVQFISANLFALLGCSLDIGLYLNKNQIFFKDLHPEIQKVICKNGFAEYLLWPPLADQYHSTMHYVRFDANTVQLESFEKYLIINVFERKQMPSMSNSYKEQIVDTLLEVFNNVIDHANCAHVYVCGQYFHKYKKLIFSIIDAGKTFRDNVSDFLRHIGKEVPKNAVSWAILPGNSTKVGSAPGGLGLPTLLDFLKNNNGQFTLISGNEIFEHYRGYDHFSRLECSFPGTIVSVEINMNDSNFYFLPDNGSRSFVF